MKSSSRSASTHAIAVRDLRKTFRVPLPSSGVGGALRALVRRQSTEVTAVDNVSFDIRRGERVAFVGPNGAGKSTTIKMLTGILHPTSGDISVLGYAPWAERRALGFHIGTVFGQRSQLWFHLPARDTFELLACVYEVERAEARVRIADLVAAFEIGPFIDKPVRQLSLGQRMRCEIVASLLHRPQVLFLDEPTIGLDVTAKSVIRDLLAQMSEQEGTTLLFTSHDTGDMERVCDRVIVIHEGTLILDRAVDDLKRSYLRRKRITLHSLEEAPSVAIDGAEVVERRPYRVVIEVDTATTSVSEVVQRTLASVQIHDLSIEDPPLEEIVQAI
ncbi:MAG: ATP-binding cassette domain-containing protein, partial [Planctomycetota bacterium]